MKEDQKQIVSLVVKAIVDKKGGNVVALDLSELPNLANFVVIAEGNVDRHVRAIANEVDVALKAVGVTPDRIEGREFGDWMVLDYGEFAIHLFMPEMRQKYQLEKLYAEGTVIDLGNVAVENG